MFTEFHPRHPRGRRRPAARRDHHGRQRPLGEAAAACRASPGIGAASKRCARIIRACIERGVEFLTLFAFSSENWRRPPDEVSILMDLFLRALEQEVAKLHENGIRFKVVGDTSVFDRRIRELMAAGEAQTAANTRLTLTVAANYGGRWDIAQAARRYFALHPEAARDDAELHVRRRSSRSWRWRTRPSPICSSAPAASSASRTSCCGSSPTPSSTSPTCCGPTSTRSRSTPRSRGIAQRERRFGRTSEQVQAAAQ